jgi:hypothetical protein
LFRIAVFIEAGTMIFIGVAFGFFGEMLSVDPHVDGMLITAVTLVIAAMLIVIGLWLKPRVLAGFNLFAMLILVLFSINMVVPRFDLSDTMRPLSKSLRSLVPDEQLVYLYKPQRSVEYGLEYYRYGKVISIRSSDEMLALTGSANEVFCITDNKTLDEVAHIDKVEMKVILSLGNQTAFLAWRRK